MSTPEELQGPVALYRHAHPPVRNVIAEYEEQMTLGQRVADRVTAGSGSWPFIIIQSGLLVAWITFNVYWVVGAPVSLPLHSRGASLAPAR